MRNLFFLLLITCCLSCNTQTDATSETADKTTQTSTKKNGKQAVKTIQKTDLKNAAGLDVEALNKDTEELKQLLFKEAIKKFGPPEDKSKIQLKEGEMSGEVQGLADKHFPNKKYVKEKVYLLEASWKKQKESWITVWYVYEDKQWKPLDVLVSI